MIVSRRSALLLPFAAFPAAAEEDDQRFHSGNQEVDLGIRKTIQFLVDLFQIEGQWQPDFAFFDDGATGNAFAALPIVGAAGPITRPKIYIGRTLVQDIVKKTDGQYGVALTGVFAHEFGHIYQMKTGYRNELQNLDIESSTRLVECHADFLAGWAMPQAFWITKVADLGFAARQFYDLGDIEFEAQTHHGTGIQRQSVMAAGYTWALVSPGNVEAAAARGSAVLRDLFPQWFRRS